VAIFATVLTTTQLADIYNTLGNPPTVTIAPASPTVFAGQSVTLTATPTGATPISFQWYYIDLGNNSNHIAHATNSTYTIQDAQLPQNGYQYGVIASNPYGSAAAAVTLTVNTGPAALAIDISPLTAEAYAGAPVTYSVGASGTLPINYQWFFDGVAVAGATNASFTSAAQCGTHTYQVSFTNVQSGGTPVTSSLATLQGDPSTTNITFNTNGTGWQVNGSPGTIQNGLLTLTDGSGGEDSSAFYTVPQYVGSFYASFIYVGNGQADGTAFVIQNTSAGAAALGGGGGELGYDGITNSIAFEFNLYAVQGVGIAFATNGSTGTYVASGAVSVATGDPILTEISFDDGIMSVSLEDMLTLATFSESHDYGPLPAILGGNLGYVGITGADGGSASVQTVTNFVFHSVIAPLALSVSRVSASSITLSWSDADPNYQLQTATSLTSPSWTAGPTPTVANDVASVSVSTTGAPTRFYRLVRVSPCP
jgi:hypothetical protein